jgi:hypothetical protein
MYEFKLREETFEIIGSDGQVMAVIICHEATAAGVETTLLSMITQQEIARNKAEIEARAKIEGKDVKDVLFTLEEASKQWTRARVYPKLMACSTRSDGERLPTADEFCAFPEHIRVQWYEAASKVNPDWFDGFKQRAIEEIKKEISEGNNETVEKYKKKSPKRRTSKKE